MKEQPTPVLLVDLRQDLVAAWREAFDGVEGVEIHHGSVFDFMLPGRWNALVSPANSFGFMDGGIDRVISSRMGWHIQKRVQEQIRREHHGELLVGNALVVDTMDEGHPKQPFTHLIAAPTMRVPMVLGRKTVNPYLATRAILLLLEHGVHGGAFLSELIEQVVIPGMGTGIGQVPVEVCARQMRKAYNETVLGQRRFPTSWHDAQTRHQLLYGDNPRDLQQG